MTSPLGLVELAYVGMVAGLCVSTFMAGRAYGHRLARRLARRR